MNHRSFSRVIIGLASFILLTAFQQQSEGLIKRKLTLKRKVQTKSETYCLSDLVEEYWLESYCDKQKETCCGYVLSDKNFATHTKAEFQEKIKKLNFGVVAVEVVGPSTTDVEQTQRVLLKSEISEKALKSLQGIKEYVGDWKVLDVRVSQDVVVPMTDNWFVEVPKSPGRLSSAVVYVGSEEDKKAVGSVQLELGFFQKAYVSKRNITANEIIKEDDFELKNTEVLSKIAGNISTNFSMYNGKLAGNLKSRSFIKRGDVLMTSALAKPSAVLSGENVTLVLRGDNLRVTTKGTSQGNAAVGEMVSVQVRNYSKTFRGKVNEDKQVEVWL